MTVDHTPATRKPDRLVLPPIFDREEAIATEGIKYAGSKKLIVPAILALAAITGAKSVLDGFSGTTRVSQAFAGSGYRVSANDTAVWSRVFGECYLMNERPPGYYQPLIAHLNALSGCDGWFTAHYGGVAAASKMPWQIHNTRKLDAIRAEIDRVSLEPIEKSVLLTSLIMALDEVDSTLGHHAAYLREWSRRSYRDLVLKVPRLIPRCASHTVTQSDVFDLLPNIAADLAYFDPPYGSNNLKMPASRVRYAAYYHLWRTVCLNDQPEIFGRASRRMDSSDKAAGSVFEEFRKDSDSRSLAVRAIERLLREVNAQHIILSYSSGGHATLADLHDAIKGCGDLMEVIEFDYKRSVMASMRWTNAWVREAEAPNKEFLFLVRK